MFRKSGLRVGTSALGAFFGCALLFLLLQLPIAAGPPPGVENGDINGDSMTDIADAVALLSYLFSNGPAPVACASGPTCPACDLSQAEVDKLSAFLALIEVDAGGNLTITAPGTIEITAGATLDANAALITLN